MDEWALSEVAIGALAVTASVLYAAWYEHRRDNARDAKLLAGLGAVGLAGTAASLLV